MLRSDHRRDDGSFILAMALGIAQRRKDGKASEKDSFGLVGIASAGAILGCW
jgi:hypothetical protein